MKKNKIMIFISIMMMLMVSVIVSATGVTLISPTNASSSNDINQTFVFSADTPSNINYCELYVDDVLNDTILDTALFTDDWVYDASVKSGMSSASDRFHPEIIEIGSTTHAISGNVGGGIFGWTWTGSTWVSNTSVKQGIANGDRTHPTSFVYNGQLHMIIGVNSGLYNGYTWNELNGNWTTNSSVITGLTDVGTEASPSVHQWNGQIHAVVGAGSGTLTGFTWNGSQWVSNSTMNAGTGDFGISSYPELFDWNGEFRMFVGAGNSGNLWSYVWDEDLLTWTYDPDFLGTFSYPADYGKTIGMWNHSGTLKAIYGETNTAVNGMVFNEADRTNISSASFSANLTDNHINTWKVSCNATTIYNSSEYQITIGNISVVISNNRNITQPFYESFGEDFDASSTPSIVSWNVNDTTNFVINNSGYLTTNGSLSFGEYPLTISVLNSEGSSDSVELIITLEDYTNEQKFENTSSLFISVIGILMAGVIGIYSFANRVKSR